LAYYSDSQRGPGGTPVTVFFSDIDRNVFEMIEKN